MNFDIINRRDCIEKAQSDLLAYRSKDRDLALRNLLDALIEDYQFDLLHTSKDSIEKKQGAVLQLIELRKFIDSPDKHKNLKI